MKGAKAVKVEIENDLNTNRDPVVNLVYCCGLFRVAFVDRWTVVAIKWRQSPPGLGPKNFDR
jgi:hypothetical protein